jgi:hypothetical protein
MGAWVRAPQVPRRLPFPSMEPLVTSYQCFGAMVPLTCHATVRRRSNATRRGARPSRTTPRSTRRRWRRCGGASYRMPRRAVPAGGRGVWEAPSCTPSPQVSRRTSPARAHPSLLHHPQIVVYRCWELPDHILGLSTDCGGFADRLVGMSHVFLLALYFRWIMFADWQGQPAVFNSPFIVSTQELLDRPCQFGRRRSRGRSNHARLHRRTTTITTR